MNLTHATCYEPVFTNVPSVLPKRSKTSSAVQRPDRENTRASTDGIVKRPIWSPPTRKSLPFTDAASSDAR